MIFQITLSCILILTLFAIILSTFMFWLNMKVKVVLLCCLIITFITRKLTFFCISKADKILSWKSQQIPTDESVVAPRRNIMNKHSLYMGKPFELEETLNSKILHLHALTQVLDWLLHLLQSVWDSIYIFICFEDSYWVKSWRCRIFLVSDFW